ncbi:MAG: hypothetical protein K2N35_17885, partial [Muribaculaceae bacterium]|nr:hypothetical protein [Muribaculaceae bacterium]
MIKRLLIGTFVSATCLVATAQTVTIYQNNGEKIKYNVSDVEKIVFEEDKPFDETNLLSEQYVPCEGFRNWIDQHLANGSGYYSLEEAAAYTGDINISQVEEITDIKGIEYFTGLTALIGEDSYFGNFDIEALKSLQYLKLVNTRVTRLDFTGLKDLQKVFISRNKLNYLNLAQNPNLQKLWCDCNELTSLDLTGCSGLTELVCSYNQLQSLILPECPLEILSAHENTIHNINLSGVKATLQHLSVANCGLNSVDVSGAKKLQYFDASSNPLLTTPDIKGCSRLEEFRLEDITAEMHPDFSDCTRINMIRMDRCNLGKSIDLTANKKLYELSLQ